MASYSLEITTTAERQLKKVSKKDKARIVRAVLGLAHEPRPDGVRKLSGYENIYRIRIGRYRVIYEIHDTVLRIIVLKLGHRRDVYR